MSVYKIAEINILINPVYDYTKRQLADYLCDEDGYEFDATAAAVRSLSPVIMQILPMPAL